MGKPAAYTLVAFRGYADDGGEGAGTPKAAQNANWSQNVDEAFRIRHEIQETNNVGEADTWQLQYNLNGAGWNNVTGSSSVLQMLASANISDTTATTNILTVGTGTFTAGRCDETDGLTPSLTIGGNNHTEHEFNVQVIGTDVSNNDQIQTRCISATQGRTVTETTIPTITVVSSTTFQESVAGTITPSGALTKKAKTSTAGTLGLSGVAAGVKTALVAVAGTLGLSGTAIAKPLIALAGSIAPTGGLNMKMYTSVAGTLGLSGIGAGVKTTFVSVAGTLGLSGIVSLKLSTSLAGTFAPSGALLKGISTALAGSVSPTGALLKQIGTSTAGSIAPSGTTSARQIVTQAVAGVLGISGALLAQAHISIVGAINPVGTLASAANYVRSAAGTLGLSGTLAGLPKIALSGALGALGALFQKTSTSKAGNIGPAGSLTYVYMPLGGSTYFESVAGVLGCSGDLASRLLRKYRQDQISVTIRVKVWSR